MATIAGLILGPHCLGWFDPLSWGNSEVITLEISRIVLCIQIVAVAVELPRKYMKKHWVSVAILLLPVMTAGWLVVGLFIWVLIPHFNYAEALLVSACVTATDPVLAAAVVGKGKFAERVPGHLRNLLSAESACNDGMAFPFIYLSLNLLIHPGDAREIVKDWIVTTILYQCIFGIILGAILGYVLRKLVAFAERGNFIDRESFLAFFIFLAFNSAGFGSVLGADDLLVSFAAGSAFGWNGDFASKTEESHVSTVIDLIINLSFFVYFGAIIPWQEFNNPAIGLDIWRLIVLAVVIIFLRRLPAVLAFKPFSPDIKSWREAAFCGHFGPIGVGAIFAVILARRDLEEHYTHHDKSLDEKWEEGMIYHQLLNTLWPIVNFVVITSIVVHGSSVAVLTLGKRLNRMAITMTFTNTTANESSSNWLSRLQKLEKTSTSFSLHRVDSDATTLRPTNNSDQAFDTTSAIGDGNEAVETSGIKYRPAGGAKRKKKKKKHGAKSNIMKTLSRSHTTDKPEPAEHRPPAEFLQLGRPSTIANEDKKQEDQEEEQETADSSPPRKDDIKATAYQEGNQIIIEDSTGEVIETLPINTHKHVHRAAQDDNMSLHSMGSLHRHLTQYSSAEDEDEAKTSDSDPKPQTSLKPAQASKPGKTRPSKPSKTGTSNDTSLNLPGIDRTMSGSSSRKAYYKKDDPNQRKIYAHQIDNILLIENEEGDIIRRYKVNRHASNRPRADSVMDKALSFVGIKKPHPAQAPALDLEQGAVPALVPEYDSGDPRLKDKRVEQKLESHIAGVLSDKGKQKVPVPIPQINVPEETSEESEEEEDVSEDSEFEDEEDEELEETEVEKTRRLAALGHLSATRHADDEEE